MSLKDEATRRVLADLHDELLIYGGTVLRWEDYEDNVWILLNNVHVFKHDPHLNTVEMFKTGAIKLDHLWVILSKERVQNLVPKLERLQPITLMGRPYKYSRADGSFDYAISSIKNCFIDMSMLNKAFDDAFAVRDFEKMIAISLFIIDAWEVRGLPLCNSKVSTLEKVANEKKVIKMLSKGIENRDKKIRKARKKLELLYKIDKPHKLDQPRGFQ
jgi:hypothetical protein